MNINELISKYNPSRLINVYVFAGPSLVSYHSIVKNDDGSYYRATKGRFNEMLFILGGGASIKLLKQLELNIEYAHHFSTVDDRLDFNDLLNKKDKFSYTSAGLSYRFLEKDIDKDGVIDKKDMCIDIPGKVELQGCPDKDNDGIADKDDACPDVAGKPEFRGCPDKDGDGVIDKDDACPDVAGKKELNGCPDKDEDGIADKDDKCPDIAGKKELGGCPDKDGDAITDKDDACPDVKGLAKFNGCPDTDGDGIMDKEDKCPDVPGVASNFGCPEPPKTFEFFKVVYFGSDKTTVMTKYTSDLDEVVTILNDHPDVKASVEGYADSQGNDDYNMRLSEKRADFVFKYLVKKGINKDRLVKSSFGEAKPAADNKTAAGRGLNRRVEIRNVK